MNGLPTLDVFNCPLDGIRLIEASAGTGKTWNISALYVRLLLEQPLTVEQILVVTFTKAATAELRERIRARLASLVRVLEHAGEAMHPDDTIPECSDPMVSGLFDHVIGAGRISHDDALRRLQLALQAFDQAAIHTIHGFCQRALGETPFAAGLPFALELSPDDSGMQHELAVDFWRREVEPAAARHPGFAAWLVDQQVTPSTLCAHLARCLKKPMAELRWPPPLAGEDEGALATVYAQAQAEWRASVQGIMQLLRQALAGLNRRSYSENALAQARRAWDAYLAANDPSAELDSKAVLVTAARLTQNAKKGTTAPQHPFFVLAEAVIAARDAQTERHARRWLALLEAWLAWAPAALHERKRQLRIVSFDDLLGNLHRALRKHAWLADVLRERYPCALIDEFQDTDPLQFDLFSHIYGQSCFGGNETRAHWGPLFLVGDPKQAIYSFRAADLHTYLAAREAADASYTLNVNQRSTAAVIEAGNRLFSGNPQAFVLPGLNYPLVQPGTRQLTPLHDDVPSAGCNVWLLPDGDDRLTKGAAQQRAAAATAAEIARLLNGAARQRILLGDRPLAPGNIAVIVQTHLQGSLIKRVLDAYGIGSVELAQDSVFSSEEAETLERVLQAIETPGDARMLRAALVTDFFGLDAAALYRLQSVDSPDAEAVGWIERLQRYRHLWLERGFAAMWRTLLCELNLAARLVAGPGGERRLTNYMHLAELVQTRWMAQPGTAALLRWLASQRQTGGGGEEAQLRLESDQNLVQIVTVHKSKGLEYAIVFCPFLWDGRLRDAASLDGIEFHDAAQGGIAVIDYALDEARRAAATEAVRREQAAEQARLLYVALTRAVHRCYLVAGIYLANRSPKEACASMLNWLVAGQAQPFERWTLGDTGPQDILAAWRALAGDTIAVGALPEDVPGAHKLLPPRAIAGALAPRSATRTTREMWRIASFSGLIANVGHGLDADGDDGEKPAATPTRPDYDGAAALLDDSASIPVHAVADTAAQIGADDILRFPRGPAAGECLHRVFELADFTDPASWRPAAERALRERPPAGTGPGSEHWLAMMHRMVDDTVSCEIRPGLRLREIGLQQRLTELEFTYPIGSFALSALRSLLRDAGYPDLPLDTGMLRGYMKGFIDLIFRHDGRWWIVDWKSNHLGDTQQDYAPTAVQNAMAQHGYHLQYLLYTVALHRYLALRLTDYDYERDIGGSLYLFIRGVRPGWRGEADGSPAGVYFDRPPRALIEALDELMQPSADAGVTRVMGAAA